MTTAQGFLLPQSPEDQSADLSSGKRGRPRKDESAMPTLTIPVPEADHRLLMKYAEILGIPLEKMVRDELASLVTTAKVRCAEYDAAIKAATKAFRESLRTPRRGE